VLLLTREDVTKLLEVDDAIEAVRTSFEELRTGKVEALRSFLDVSQYDGIFLAMSAHVKGVKGMGLKVVTAYKENGKRFGLPTIFSTLLLYNPASGEPLAVMDGAHLTAMRTAAGSALATQYLSRPDSHALGIIGTGVQGRTHLAAILRVRDITKVLAYDVDPSGLREFIDEMSTKLSIGIAEVDNPRQLVEESDVIVTSTTSAVPVFKGEWLRKGTHINSVMSITPTMRELDDLTISESRIVVDDVVPALREAGDIIEPLQRGLISEDDISSLADVIAGRKEGRKNSEEITIFKSVGVPSHDVCVALKIYQKAMASGAGNFVSMQ